MASLTGTVADPDVRAAAKTMRGVRNTADAGLINTITSAVGAIGSGLASSQASDSALEKSKAVGEVEKSRLDLENERLTLAARSQEITNFTTQAQLSGGEIDEEEQGIIDGFSGELEKINQAKKSGVLNQNRYQIRLNSLHKQALTASEDLGIATNINALFGKGRQSAVFESPEQTAFKVKMNTKYGEGGWDSVDAGKEQAKGIRLAGIEANVSSFLKKTTGEIAVDTGIIMEEQNLAFQRQVIANNGVASQEMLLGFQQQQMGKINGAKQRLVQAFAQLKEQGLPFDSGKLRDQLAELDEMTKMWTGFDSFDNYDAATQLQNRVNLVDLSVETETGITREMITSGAVNDMAIEYTNMVGLSEPQLALLAEDNPAFDTGEDMRKFASKMLGKIYSAQASYADFGEDPVVRNIAQKSFASSKPKGDNPNQYRVKVQEYQHGFRLRVTDDTSSLVGRANNHVAASKNMLASGNPSAVLEVEKGYLHNIKELVRRGEQVGLTTVLNEDGTVSSSDDRVATGRGAATRPTAEVRAVHNAIVSLVAGVQQTAGVISPDKVLKALAPKAAKKEEEEVEPSVAPEVRGAGRGGSKALNEITLEDVERMSPEEKREMLSKVGIDLPVEA